MTENLMKPFLLLLYVLSFACLAAPAPAQRAILRVEVGLHSARVNKLSADAKGTLLATAADDKTVRLWNLPDGSPYATLRPPIGDGIKGELYAVALSPDGKTVVAGGETGGKAERFSLYLFDTEKRLMIARIADQPSPIAHLAYSRDGKRFAGAFSGGFGIKLWEAESGQAIAKDEDYAERCTWLDFDAGGNLASVSYDGYVRVYDNDLKLVGKIKPRPQAHPYSVAYSPSGEFLAVGYADAMEIDILRANGLKTAKTLSAGDLSGKNAAAVAWGKKSSGEEILMAAGDMKNAAGQSILRAWSNPLGAKPKVADTAVAEDIVTDIAGIESDGIDAVFSSADASWGGTKDARLAFKNKANLWDARVVELEGNGLRVSADGFQVEFPLDPRAEKKLLFDLGKLPFEARKPGGDEHVTAALTEHKSLKISNWRRDRPKLNGRALKLDEYELSYALAIDRNSGNFLLGTNYKLRLFDGKGREIQAIALPAPAYGVNVSGDGKLAIAALGDGTLHWYSLAKNELLEELTTLFPYNEGKRWIGWTQEGFFAHSDGGGADLAGYHIDKGDAKRPEWVGFSQIYQAYYAPELVLDKLRRDETLLRARLASMDKAQERLNKYPAPIVELVEYCLPKSATKGFQRVKEDSPGQKASSGQCQAIAGQGMTRGFSRVQKTAAAAVYRTRLERRMDAIRLHYRVKGREDGGVGNVDIYVNGQLQHTQAPPATMQGSDKPMDMESDIALGDGDNRILVQAYEKTGGAAEKSMLVEVSNPPSSESQAETKSKAPKLIVASIGIDRYASPNELTYSVKDASDFLEAVEKGKSDAYDKVVTYGVFNDKATAKNIDGVFSQIQEIADPNDTVLIYFSGHGLREDMNYYFIPYDGNGADLDKTALSQQRMKENIAKLSKVGKVFLFIDSCHSGAFELDGVREEISSFDKLKHQFGDNIFILAASRADQEAQDMFRLENKAVANNGLFAYAVLEGLKGAAARREDNIVDNYTLGTYVRRRVDSLSDQQKLYKQKARFQAMEASDIEPFDITKAAK
jgi:hypothetical protein